MNDMKKPGGSHKDGGWGANAPFEELGEVGALICQLITRMNMCKKVCLSYRMI